MAQPGTGSFFLAGLLGAVVGGLVVGLFPRGESEPVRRGRDPALEREIHSLRTALATFAEERAVEAERRALQPRTARTTSSFPADIAGEVGIADTAATAQGPAQRE